MATMAQGLEVVLRRVRRAHSVVPHSVHACVPCGWATMDVVATVRDWPRMMAGHVWDSMVGVAEQAHRTWGAPARGASIILGKRPFYLHFAKFWHCGQFCGAAFVR